MDWCTNPQRHHPLLPWLRTLDESCENILHGYLYDGDLVFVILKGISIFKFPKWVLASHFFSSSANLKTWLPNHWCPFPLHSHGSMPSKQQSHILIVYQTHVFAKLHKQIEHWLRKKKLIETLKGKDWMQWQLFQNSWSYWHSFFWQVMHMHSQVLAQ